MSRKADQLASTIRAALADVLARGLSDPRLEGCLLTITELHVSDDLRSANVGVSVLPAKHQGRAVAALRHAGGHLRRLIGESTDLTAVPTLYFSLDEGPKRQAGVIESLRKAREGRAYPESTGDSGRGGSPAGDHSS